jgi:flagellar motor switch protein FliN/FliY
LINIWRVPKMQRSKPHKVDDLTHAFEWVNEPPSARAMAYESLEPTGQPVSGRDLGMVLDLPLDMTVELGRTKLSVGELLSTHPGAVLSLDIKAGDPLNIMVNGCLVAKGEIVVSDEKYGIRLTEIVTRSERLRNLRN